MPDLTKAQLQEALDAVTAERDELQKKHDDLAAQLEAASQTSDPEPEKTDPPAAEKVEEAGVVIEGATHQCAYGGDCACDNAVNGHGCPAPGHVQQQACLEAMTLGGGDASGSHKCASGHWCSCEEKGGDGLQGHGCPTPFHDVAA